MVLKRHTGLDSVRTSSKKQAFISSRNYHLPDASVDNKLRHLSGMCAPLQTGHNSTEFHGCDHPDALKNK